MDLRLSGRTALVLASSGGLGLAVANTLADEGAAVCIVGRSAQRLAKACGGISDRGGTCSYVEADLFEASSIKRVVAWCESRLGPVDILFNNTGGPPPSPAEGQPQDSWRRWFDRLVMRAIAAADEVMPSMRRRRWGRIITTTSSGVAAPIPGLAMSNCLRLALCGWSKTLASELAPHGITCNIVVPGRFDTSRVAALDRKRAETAGRTLHEQRQLSLKDIPIGRYGTADEYGDVVAFLASERASYITGTQIRIDGGLLDSL